MRNLTFDQWEDRYEPIFNEDLGEDALFGGLLYETDDLTLATFRDGQIWTWVEGDEGSYIVPGVHVVNCLGFFVTAKEHNFEEITVEVD